MNARIVGYDGRILSVIPEESIERDLLQKLPENIDISFEDGRSISREQQKKIYATIGDISFWSGDNPECLKWELKCRFCSQNGLKWFSLSNVDMSTAKEFINYLIEFCLYHNIPTRDTLLNQTDDVDRYLYLCLEHRKCAICNKPAEVHHVDRIGMGRDREQIVHVGLKAIALCREHHDMAHRNEKKLFDYYHIYGIKLDEYLCKKLKLRTGKSD